MKATYPMPALFALILGIVSCSRTGDLSGDVFIMRGERPVRGAGVEILVISASEQVEPEVRKLIRDYDRKYGAAIKREELECRKDEALERQIETDPTLRKKTDEYAKAELLKMKNIPRYPDPERERFMATRHILVELGGGKCPLFRIDRDAELDKLVHAHVYKLGRETKGEVLLADVNGRYEVNGLPVGRHYLSATMGSGNTWLIPVQIGPGPQKVHLSNSNKGSLRFLTKEAGGS